MLAGKYLVVVSKESLFAGIVIWGDQVKRDVKSGVYADGDVVMHIETGRLYRIREFQAFELAEIESNLLTSRQRDRANKWRREAWPERGHRKGIGSTTASGVLPEDI